jgi:prepilin-type N-terminal cleavage/methylation domain-containing protein
MKARHGERGFTLTEALISLAIAALAAQVVLEQFTGSAARLARASEDRRATQLAQDLVAQADATGWPDAMPVAGATPDGLRWRVDLRRDASALPGGGPSLTEITVTISTASGQRAQHFSTARVLATRPPE